MHYHRSNLRLRSIFKQNREDTKKNPKVVLKYSAKKICERKIRLYQLHVSKKRTTIY